MPKKFGIPLAPRRVKQYMREVYGIEVEAPSYRRFFDFTVSDRFPAEFVNNRWQLDEADLDEIARAFRLVPDGAVKRMPEVATA